MARKSRISKMAPIITVKITIKPLTLRLPIIASEFLLSTDRLRTTFYMMNINRKTR